MTHQREQDRASRADIQYQGYARYEVVPKNADMPRVTAAAIAIASVNEPEAQQDSIDPKR